MEVRGKLLVYGTRDDARLVVQTLYYELPRYGKAFINESHFYNGAYEVRYEYSVHTTIDNIKVKAKLCLALTKLRLIPRIKAIKQL